MRSRRSLLNAAVASAVLAVAVGGGVAIAEAGHGKTASHGLALARVGPPRLRVNPHSQLGRNNLAFLRSRFAIFSAHRRARTAHGIRFSPARAVRSAVGATDSVAVGAWVPGHELITQYGLLTSAETTVTFPSGQTLSIVPGASGVCMLWSIAPNADGLDGQGGCDPHLTLLANRGMYGSVASTPGNGGPAIIGLVPNGTTSVTLQLRSGATVSAVATQNVIYIPNASGALTEATLHTAAGSTSYAFTGGEAPSARQ